VTQVDRAGPDSDRDAPIEPVPSTVRGPLAGLQDLAAALRPRSRRQRVAGGIVLGALVGGVVAALRRHRSS
jgi:uncharacterized protein YcfJ